MRPASARCIGSGFGSQRLNPRIASRYLLHRAEADEGF